MNSKKGRLLLLAVSALGALSLGGCSGNDDPNTIKFLSNRTDLDSNGTYARYIAKFNEKYPDIKVQVKTMTDYAGDLEKMLTSGDYGDVSMISITAAEQLPNYYVSFGKATDLEATGKYRNGYLYSKYYNGEVYGMPSMNTVSGIVYNKQVFADASIDVSTIKTPDDFLAAMQKIKDSDNGKAKDCIPYYTNAREGWIADQWEDHLSGGLLTGDENYRNNTMCDDKNAWKKDANDSHYIGTKLYFDLMAKGLTETDHTTTDWEGSKAKINNGEIGCMVLGNWAIKQCKEAGSNPDDIGYMPFPFVASDGKHYATSGSDYSYGISKKSKKQEAAKKFVTFMVEESGYAEDEGGISVMANDAMPSGLEAFANCEFLVQGPATSKYTGVIEKVEELSGLKLYDSGARFSKVVTAATGSNSYDEKLKAFNALTDGWNSKWVEAVDKVANSK